MVKAFPKRPLSRVMNVLGLRAMIALAALCWTVGWWGLCVPAVIAGLALGLLGQQLLTRLLRRSAHAREEALRRGMGGEMVLDEMLLCAPADAVKAAVTLLQESMDIAPVEQVREGVLCRFGHERVMVTCLQRHPEGEIGCDDVAACVRAYRRLHADSCILCATCGISSAARAWVEEAMLPVMLIDRAKLERIAGNAYPATDEQVLAMQARKHPTSTVRALLRQVLHPGKARRYMGYGLGLTLLYVASGLRWYLLPGLLCMTLAALSRCGCAEGKTKSPRAENRPHGGR